MLVETDDTWGRNVVESICRYGVDQGWQLLIGPRDSQGRLRVPRGWHGSGVIASLRTTASLRHVKQLNLPVVDVSAMVAKRDWFSRVATDDDARAEMALGHLCSRGVSSFACYAPPIGRYSDVRSDAFQNACRAAGFECQMYQTEGEESSGWLTNYSNARRWLAGLPQPVGIFAADPYPARQLVEICTAESVRIPEDVLLLSGDDDDLLCHVASPQISAIDLASHKIGQTAASVLTRVMNGSRQPMKTMLISPLGIRERHSTDLLAFQDDEIAQILRFIRDHAIGGITVADLLREFPISRRRLEQSFRSSFDRSPAEEIRRIRLDHVCRLLIDTDRSIASIADVTGFATGASLSQTFRKQFGESPRDYRKSRR